MHDNNTKWVQNEWYNKGPKMPIFDPFWVFFIDRYINDTYTVACAIKTVSEKSNM